MLLSATEGQWLQIRAAEACGTTRTDEDASVDDTAGNADADIDAVEGEEELVSSEYDVPGALSAVPGMFASCCCCCCEDNNFQTEMPLLVPLTNTYSPPECTTVTQAASNKDQHDSTTTSSPTYTAHAHYLLLDAKIWSEY